MSSEAEGISIDWKELFQAIQGLKTNRLNRINIKREVVPIVFVPGIMGSRLIDTEYNKKAWDPDDMGFMLKNYAWIGAKAAERKALLVGKSFEGNFLSVDENDTKHNKRFHHFPEADRRGWGGVAWSSYEAILSALQSRVWSEPLRHCFEFPVHAVGYNWTNTNDESGKLLAKKITELKAQYSCQGVILVTHSMGGLVARSACMLHGAEPNVLGVIHGNQPATGSPTAYWRMKAGFERPAGGPTDKLWDWFKSPVKMAQYRGGGFAAAVTLGTDGEEVTSILGNIPGGLELLPSKHYKDNDGHKEWLNFENTTGETVRLPQADPYREIYRRRGVFYRLVNPLWLSPGEKNAGKRNRAWEKYLKCLKMAEAFHDKLQLNLHKETCQFFSKGIKTCDRIIWTRASHEMVAKAKRMLAIAKSRAIGKAATTGGLALVKVAAGGAAFTPVGLAVSAGTFVGRVALEDSDWYVNRGGCREYVDDQDQIVPEDVKNHSEIVYELTLESASGDGDGTVPTSSGGALAAKTSDLGPDEATVIIGDEAPWFDRFHEPIYKSGSAQHAAAASIENYCLAKVKREAG